VRKSQKGAKNGLQKTSGGGQCASEEIVLWTLPGENGYDSVDLQMLIYERFLSCMWAHFRVYYLNEPIFLINKNEKNAVKCR